MKRRLLFKHIIEASILTTFIILSCAPTKPYVSSFGIYLTDSNELFLSDQDISAYFQINHKIVLNKAGISKWNARISYNYSYDPPIPVIGELYQKPFAIKIDDRVIYGGNFWTNLSSLMYDSIVILDIGFPCDSINDTIEIKNGYPYGTTNENDPRNNIEIFNLLSQKGLLK